MFIPDFFFSLLYGFLSGNLMGNFWAMYLKKYIITAKKRKEEKRKWKNKSGHLKKKTSKLKYFKHNAHLEG